MIARITVLHNYGPTRFLHYEKESADLHEAYQVVLTHAAGAEEALRDIWTICNVDDAAHLQSINYELWERYGDDVRVYRSLRNRSLSVGDVVIVQPLDNTGPTTVWSCDSLGWTKLDHMPEPYPTPANSRVSASYLRADALAKEQE